MVNVLPRNECYIYLGKPLSVAGEQPSHVTDIYDKYCELLDNIVAIDLPIPIKVEALEVIAMSKISHHFANIIINEENLKLFDIALCRALRKIFLLPHSATVRTFFQPKVNGGLGVRKPSLVYQSSRITHLINMLDHEDENIKYVARNSLILDMLKRSVPRSEEEPNFLGYKIKANGYLDTHIKGGFGTSSDWPHLHRTLQKLHIRAYWEHPTARNLTNAGKIFITSESGKIINENKTILRRKIQDLQLEKDARQVI